MEETVGSLDKAQLTRLAQYFDEKVTYPPKSNGPELRFRALLSEEASEVE
jgi:hypothetical protein